MIKYFSQILSKFSVKQRITALIILSILLVIITLGPIIIKTVDPGNKELKTRIDHQDLEIKRLNINLDSANIKIYTLNQTIIQNQEDCTNKVIEREKQITKLIDNIINKKIKLKNYYQTDNFLPEENSEI